MESAGLSLPAVRPAAGRAARAFVVVAPAVGVVALAAVLRFAHLERVPDNPFYDAAVRSMSLSWHNFFFGAFDPSARLAIDKPPLDLWLQVASVKLLGFNSFALKLPEALGGTIAVALLYDLVRRPFGRAAGFLAALALAVLPAAVLTGRSDTMDSVMSALMVAALWLALVGAQRHRAGLLYLAAVAVGLAFNVKLFEALLVAPPLVLLWAIAGPRGLARRVEQLLVAGVVMIVVSLSWATAVSLVPSQHRPYPIGSTDGTVWNAMFVWDGLDRFNGKAGSAATAVHHHHRISRHRKELLALRARRARADGPGTTRLLASRLDIGSELVPALILGALGLVIALVAWLARLRARPWEPEEEDRNRWAVAGSLGTWLVLGVVLFSVARTLHTRYLEAFSPAIAGVLGIGMATSVRHLGAPLAAVGWGRRRFDVRWIVAVAVGAALLATPTSEALRLVAADRSDSGQPGNQPEAEVARVSAYLRAHTARQRYEFATPLPATAGPFIVRDARPVLVLLRLDHRPLVSTATLKRLVRHGAVRYALLGRPCSHRHGRSFSRIDTTRWICTRGKDVGRRAGVRRGVLFHLRP